jgi:homoserine O-succinyltransferase/O-acetyltransferase
MTARLDITKLAKSVGRLPVQPEAAVVPSGLRIGLVNNMPDGALLATEQQFAGLVAQATGGQITLELYYLPGLSRGEAATKILNERYRPVTDLYHSDIDALIVTGNEPRAARLDQEPYWHDMTTLVDWARHHTASTFWSCLAAHAAVLHLDKVERRRLPSKRSGVYQCQTRGSHNVLPESLAICHSRLNEVTKDALENAGYSILSQCHGGEVDMFMKSMPSRFLFLQGHPEYAALSLAREYRRDVERYLSGTREDYPEMPENYFNVAATIDYQKFRQRAEILQAERLMEKFPEPALRPGLADSLALSAAAVFNFWMEQVSEVSSATKRQPIRLA